MLTKGFAGTSVEEVCAGARLTKGCFFHYFLSKEDLGKTLLERFCSKAKVSRSSVEKDPLRRVYGAVDGAIQRAKECTKARGCLLGTLAQELSDTRPDIRAVCEEGFSIWAQGLRKDLEEARRRYAPRRSFDPQSLAEHFIAVLEGSQILAKAAQDPKIVERNLLHFKRYLKSLLGK